MAYNGFNDGQPRYYYYYPSAPVTFPEPSSNYLEDNYRRDYRRQDSDRTRHGVVPMQEVFSTEGAGVPWWLSSDHPHGGHDGHYWQYNEGRDERRPHHDYSTVEMYVPLCCDQCERKVRKHLKDMAGVESVSADQWAKKVVVHGYNLHPHFLLRRIQRDKPGSVFWSDRPQF